MRDGYNYHIAGSTYDNPEQSLMRKRGVNGLPAIEEDKPICPMPKCCSPKSSAWKFWAVALSILLIFCLIGIAIGVAWSRSSQSNVFGDEGPRGPDIAPAICYKCSNYEHLMDGRRINDGSDLQQSGAEGLIGGVEVVGALGVAVDVENPRGSLCQESVNRTVLAETESPENDDCGDSVYNGCFKMVTKSYRLTANIGRELLSATVVTRNCMHIPRSQPLGCFKTFGGAGMERETCYCKGNYCNSQGHPKALTPLIGFLAISIALANTT